jgi:selenocysteine-specific elongation factor
MIVGTAGHIDHGKTALVRALTGVDTDRLKEEKARGITIDLGFAYLPTPDGQVLGFVDVPGHERFVHNMLAGATGIDFVLLVVACDDGVMPQTVEHLAIIDLLGIDRGLVALTKADLGDADRRAQVTTEIANLLAPTALAGAPILPVSAMTGEGIDDLRAALFQAAADLGSRAGPGRFRLSVDRCFTLAGAGTVVTGTVLSGQVSVGDQVTVSPSGIAARVRSIHAQNRPAEQGRAGDRCALNLAGEAVSKDAVHRGDVVLDPYLHAPSDRIDAVLRVLRSEAKPVGQWLPVRLHHAASEVGARVVLLGDPVQPGEEGLIQLVLEKPLAAAIGDRFVLRDTSAQRTIAGGRFLDLRAPARKRRTPERMALLAAQKLQDASEALDGLLAAPPRYVDLGAFARDRALEAATLENAITLRGVVRVAVGDGELGLAAGAWTGLRQAMAEKLKTFHAENPDLPGIGLERMRMQLEPRLPAKAFAAALQGLARKGEIGLDGAWVRLPGHAVKLTPNDEALWRRVQPLLAGAERFRPPRVRDIAGVTGAPEAGVRRLLKLLGRMGKVDEVAQDHFFLRATVAEMVGIALDLSTKAPDAQFAAAAFRDRMDNGRKVAIQILEFFDRHGVTLRRGDQRRINKHRLDLFRLPVVEADTSSGREASLVGRPDFKSGRGREPVLGGFDSHSLPPTTRRPPTSQGNAR